MVYIAAYGPARPEELAGLPDDFTFYDLRHTRHTLSPQSGAILNGTMVRAGQSSEKAEARRRPG